MGCEDLLLIDANDYKSRAKKKRFREKY